MSENSTLSSTKTKKRANDVVTETTCEPKYWFVLIIECTNGSYAARTPIKSKSAKQVRMAVCELRNAYAKYDATANEVELAHTLGSLLNIEGFKIDNKSFNNGVLTMGLVPCALFRPDRNKDNTYKYPIVLQLGDMVTEAPSWEVLKNEAGDILTDYKDEPDSLYQIVMLNAR